MKHQSAKLEGRNRGPLFLIFAPRGSVTPGLLHIAGSQTLLERRWFSLDRDWLISSITFFISTSKTYGNLNTIGLIYLSTVILDAASKT